MEKVKTYTTEEIEELSKTYPELRLPYYVWKRELLWKWLIESKGCELRQ